jgi:hypothetical protein
VPPALHCLLPPNPKSQKYLELFRSLLSYRDERTSILALSEEDAKLFIEIIDMVRSSRTFLALVRLFTVSLDAKVLRAAKLELELRKIAFSVLRRLCGRIGHLPKSYQLSEKFDLSEMAHASGGFADVRTGVFKGKDVAVKSLRIAILDDKLKIRKVGGRVVASHPGSLTHCAAVLQRGCLMEELVPPQRSRSHWSP